jgi:hypothetical protein
MRYFEILFENLTDTDAFKRWFGDSKVVDSAGRPLRMYHGSTHNHIRKFEVGYNSWGNKDFSGNHKVVSFTSDPNFAENYAGDIRPDRKPTIYPVYIRSVNPGDFRKPEHCEMVTKYQLDNFNRFIDKVTNDPNVSHIWTPEKIEKKLSEERTIWNNEIPNGSWMFWERPKMWKHFGWDGAWAREDSFHRNKNVLNFAVEHSNQVKSAVGNNGNFDPENPEITG